MAALPARGPVRAGPGPVLSQRAAGRVRRSIRCAGPLGSCGAGAPGLCRRMTALPRRAPRRSWSSPCPAASGSAVEPIRAVIVRSASICATVVSPSGEIRGIGRGGMVTRGDLPLREPAFAGREDGRDQASAGPDDPGVAADRVRAADQVQDGTGAAGVSGAQRIDHVRGLAVVPLPRAEPRRRRRGRRRSRARRGSAPSAPRSRRPRRPRPSPRRARRVATQQLRRAPLRGHRQILGARGRP
jgi:hypothetical protein